MYRVLSMVGLAVAAAGCSLGPASLSSGYSAPSYTTTAAISPRGSQRQGHGKSTSGKRSVQMAKLTDKAPSGSYESPTKGILSNRDYSSTQLNAEMARDMINFYRREKGLKPLKLSPELTEAAKNHARDLAKWDRISHYGSDGSNPWDRVKRTGYNARLAAENVGTGQINFDEVIRGWKKSPGHNKNLLMTDAEHMGIALVQDPNTEFKSFWTLVLGARMN